MKSKKNYEMNMCEGPILSGILKFSVPLMLSGILQLLFNAADIIVVGRFAGNQSLASVGATSSLINMLVNIFIGLSVGTSVMVSRYYGGKSEKDVGETVHTAICMSIVSGIVLIFLGIGLSRVLLELMGTPDDVLEKAVLYMRIYFVGMPFLMLYNFGSAILRAIGDTKRPLYYLTLAGIVNVVLNMVFVIVFHMDVAGVALATVISQVISTALVLKCLMKSDTAVKLTISGLKIHKSKLIRIMQVGLPAGMQAAIFSVSNVVIQTSVNSFGSVAVAGNTAASNIEAFVYTALNALYQADLSFTSQNLGGEKYGRIDKIYRCCMVTVTVMALVLGLGTVLAGEQLLGIYSSDPQVIAYGMIRLRILLTVYFTCAWMDTIVGSIRGVGCSVLPMIVTLTGACGLRVIWVLTIFQWFPTLDVLFLAFPVTWLVTAAAHIVCWKKVRKKLPAGDI